MRVVTGPRQSARWQPDRRHQEAVRLWRGRQPRGSPPPERFELAVRE